MAQNIINGRDDDDELNESNFYMLWDAILNLHFPFTTYGIALQNSVTSNGTKQNFFLVQTARLEHVVVVELNKSSEETKAEMDIMQAELVEFIKEHFSQTQYPTIYGIGCIGFSWIAFRRDKAVDQPTITVPRRGDLVSNQSFSLLKAIADEVHAMTSQVWP